MKTYFLIFSHALSLLLGSTKVFTEDVADSEQGFEDLARNELDHVGMTKEAAELRSQYLRNKKPFLRKRTTIANLLFPGVSPEDYVRGESLQIFAESVESKNTNVPFDFYKLPVCPMVNHEEGSVYRKNLGQRLMGYSFHPTSYEIHALQNKGCTTLCHMDIGRNQLKFLQKLIRDRYRIHFTLDSLPVVMRSSQDNYVVRGFPVGFIDETSSGDDAIYLYNHCRFTIYYNNKEAGVDSDQKILNRITGFDIHPVSITHQSETCDPGTGPVLNDPENFFLLNMTDNSDSLSVTYSYEVSWVVSDVAVRPVYCQSCYPSILYFSSLSYFCFLLILCSVG